MTLKRLTPASPELLRLQGLAANYRRHLKGLRVGRRKTLLRAALRRTQAQIRICRRASAQQ